MKSFSPFVGKKHNDNQATDPVIKEDLQAEFSFDFDPCPEKPEFNGLDVEWGETNWVNPPYTYTEKWIDKGLKELDKGKTSVFLIPARPCTTYWRNKVIPNATSIRWLTCRPKFGTHKKGFPIPLALVTFKPGKKPFKVIHKRNFSYFESM